MGFGAYHRQGGLPRIGAQTRVTPGRYTGVAYVLQVFERDWRATLRDCTHDELQPHKAKVIGPILPPVHAPDDPDNPVFSIALYGFFGGRREDSWCIPVHNQQFTSEERAANSFFLRLLGVDVRIGKEGDDTVYEISDGNFVIRCNSTQGDILIKSKTAKNILIEAPNAVVDMRGNTVKGTASGSGEASLAFKSEVQSNTTAYNPHKHIIPLVGTSGPPDTPMTPPTGTQNLKGT